MKALVATDALTAYPDHNKPFHIYTDASDYQMGACIMQENRPVAYYSAKLNPAQRNYTTMEKELLSIVMTLKQFRTTLLGAEIHIHTDHKNLTCEHLNTQRVLRWRMYVEEYHPKIHYIPGSDNAIADGFSRVPRKEDIEEEKKAAQAKPDDELESYLSYMKDAVNSLIEIKRVEYDDMLFLNDSEVSDDLEAFYSMLDDPELFECLINLPEVDTPQHNPLNYSWIHEQQQADNQLIRLQRKKPENYITKEFEDNVKLICYVAPGDDAATQWRICLTEDMIPKVARWFHEILGHPGYKRLTDSMQSRYYHPRIRYHCERLKCEHCDRHKISGPGYGLLPERELREQPWEEVCIDLIGPWKVKVGNRKLKFKALTCIDPVTGLVEMVRIDNKTAEHVIRKFEHLWLARYPWPRRCVHDNGGEFIGHEFQMTLEAIGIKDVTTTSYNPTANAICERMHQTVGNILRTVVHSTKPRNTKHAKDMVDDALSTAAHAMRSSINTALKASPGALVYSRDMFLNIPMIADWHLIAQRQEQLINENLRRHNLRRRRYDYAVGQQVLIKNHEITKMGLRTHGPYKITQVHCNGNVTLDVGRDSTERINIKRIQPFLADKHR